MTDPHDMPSEDPTGPSPRIPPHSPETEAAVLSAWSLHDRFGKSWTPEPELFHMSSHRMIAEAMASMDHEVRDEASLFAQMDALGTLAKAGGTGAVHMVVKGAPAYGDPWPHVARLREYRAMREMLVTMEVAAAEAYEHKNLGALVGKLQDAIRAGAADTKAKVFTVAELLQNVAKEMQDERDPDTCSTGLPTLDHHTGGFQHKQVAVMGAATSWGKSSYAVFLSDITLAAGRRPLIVSFEDPEEMYGRRLMARRARVNPNVLRGGKRKRSNQEWDAVIDRAERAEKIPFFINAIGRSAERVATDIRCVCASEDIDLVMVDYLQAIQSAKRQQDRRNEVTYVARVMTDVIKSSGCAGLMFSQFKRQMKAGDKPTMHDLKESGDLENAAEMVLVGFLNDEGNHILRTEKVKDGMRRVEYELGWDGTYCGFTGEVAVQDAPEDLDESEQRYP